MRRAFFVTGTDTGVGKTLTSAAVILELQKNGLNVGALKPVETGCSYVDGNLEGSDSRLLAASCNNGCDTSLYKFTLPAAPLMAAKNEDKKIDIDSIIHRYKQMLNTYDATIVEGVGGLLVPFNNDFFVLDLIIKLQIPVIIVAGDSLGTINHTLLTYNQLVNSGAVVAGVIVNSAAAASDDREIQARDESFDYLKLYFTKNNTPVLGRIPFLKEANPLKFAAIASTYVDFDSLLDVK